MENIKYLRVSSSNFLAMWLFRNLETLKLEFYIFDLEIIRLDCEVLK